jgi:hypothetical protein
MIDYREFKNKMFQLSRSEIIYNMQLKDKELSFKLLPRTVARLEAVYAILDDDARRRKNLENLDLTKDDLSVDLLPEPEYIVRWKIFKIITDGPHDEVEEAGLEEHLDLDMVDEAITDFFDLSSRSARKYNLMQT